MSKNRSARLWFGFALCFALLAVLLTGIHSDSALLLFPKGSPEDCADSFFAALKEGNYEGASALCDPALPPESYPKEADAAKLYDALCDSRRWQRQGVAVRKGNHATVSGTLTVLDPAALTEGMKEEVNTALSTLVDKARLSSEIYNDDGSYKDEAIMKAWDMALSARLEKAGDYIREVPLELRLLYRDGQWLVAVDEELMCSLSGGIA